MEINEGTYGKIRHILPVQRGRVTVENITFINALLYICENGCKWRRLPKEYGKWHVIYKCFNRWVKGGLTCKIHMMALDARTAAEFILSGGRRAAGQATDGNGRTS